VPSTPQAIINDTVLAEMALVSWRDILGALSAMLGACEQEAVVQYVLKAYQTFAATCGELELHQARDALLVSLCQFSLPGWKPSSGVGASVMSSIVEAGWRVGANKRATLTRKHILVRVAVVGKGRERLLGCADGLSVPTVGTVAGTAAAGGRDALCVCLDVVAKAS
jgi:hypothetical protein